MSTTGLSVSHRWQPGFSLSKLRRSKPGSAGALSCEITMDPDPDLKSIVIALTAAVLVGVVLLGMALVREIYG
jgi:hypothetical protein